MSRTLYLSKKQADAMGIDLSIYPSAGPRPSVSGMKKLYWGKDAHCIQQGVYVYKVPKDIYEQVRGY